MSRVDREEEESLYPVDFGNNRKVVSILYKNRSTSKKTGSDEISALTQNIASGFNFIASATKSVVNDIFNTFDDEGEDYSQEGDIDYGSQIVTTQKPKKALSTTATKKKRSGPKKRIIF